MRKSRFTEAQVIGMIKEQEAGMPTAEAFRHAVEQGSQIPDVERRLFTIEADIGERAFGALFCGACQHCLELGVGHADEALT
jgi:putative transposase